MEIRNGETGKKKSESGIYHVVLRGINGQNIFEDDEDNIRFLETLEKYRTINGYSVLAYCLMGNHLHLLLKTGEEDLSVVFKRISVSYVYWYNWKYDRNGHLFQDRYKSEAVDDDGYLLTVLRYIHQNPLKAGLYARMEECKYSSYNTYVKGTPSIVDTSYVFSLLDKRAFEEFHHVECSCCVMDVEDKVRRLRDPDAIAIMRKISKCKSLSEFQQLDASRRDKFV
jgi:REP element-mobilizing transposase RayT